MRIGLPRLLLISAVLHVAVVSAFFFHAHSHGRAALSSGNSPDVTLIYTLDSESASDRLLAHAGSYSPDPNPDGTSAPPLPAEPAPSSADTSSAAALALKNNSRMHVRWPESVLNPASAPHVGSGQGTVFILDVSGSMYEPFAGTTRLDLARQVLAQQIHALRDGTPFALVVYGERAQRSGPLVRASDATRTAAVQFLNGEYNLGGGTNLPSGLALAAELDMGAIFLVTDGDLNMRQDEVLSQARQILGPAGTGPALTIVAVAPRPGTDNREILEALAAFQGGTFLLGKFPGRPDLLTDKADSAP